MYKAQNQNSLFTYLVQDLSEKGEEFETTKEPIITLPEPIHIELNYSSSLQPILSHSFSSYNPFYVLGYTIVNVLGTTNVERLLTMSRNIIPYMNLEESSTDTLNVYGNRINTQINEVVKILTDFPNYKQAIIEVWSKNLDLGSTTTGPLPTVHIQFAIKDGKVTMHVHDTANNLLSAFFGGQATYLGYLHSLVAYRLKTPLGYSTYDIHFPYMELKEFNSITFKPLCEVNFLETFPLVKFNYHQFRQELDVFWFNDVCLNVQESFIRRVAQPIMKAWEIYSTQEAPGKYTNAIYHLGNCRAIDWKVRCQEWVQKKFEVWSKRE